MDSKARKVASQIIERVAAKSPMPIDEVVWRESDTTHCLEFHHQNRCLGSIQLDDEDVRSLERGEPNCARFALRVQYTLGWYAN